MVPLPRSSKSTRSNISFNRYEDAAKRAISAGLDGIEFHVAHGYLPWQFLSPLYNKRTDHWGGSYEKRLRFSIEAMRRIRKRIGDRPFIGYRINSTSFWEGDLEIEDIKRIHTDFRTRDRHRLCERIRRGSPLLDSYTDDLRRVGGSASLHPRH